MINRPLSARTRKGNRIYRHPFSKNGKTSHTENYTFRVKRAGKIYYFNVGTEKKKASALADEIAAFLSVKSNDIHEAIVRFSPGKAAPRTADCPKHRTVGALAQRYEEVTAHLSRATVRDNIGALRRISAFILGLPVNGKKMEKTVLLSWNEKVDAMELTCITPRQLEAFRSSVISSAGTDQVKRGRATTTSNFYFRAAGSIFSAKIQKHLSDFELPQPNPFKEISLQPEPSHRYVSKINVAELITKAETELEKSHPGSYLAFLLSLYCGMRRSEIDLLTWEQIDFANRHIWIRTTEFFRPKAKNSEDRIDAPLKVFEALEKFRPLSTTPPYVLPGTDPVYPPRCKQIFRHLLAWLRSNGVEYAQALHALRKEAGSLMFSQTGSIDRAAEFLRNDPRVARDHYIGRKGRLELELPTTSTGQKKRKSSS